MHSRVDDSCASETVGVVALRELSMLAFSCDDRDRLELHLGPLAVANNDLADHRQKASQDSAADKDITIESFSTK